MKYIYGPIKSRRLGFSLGISITPYKVCSFDCVYCQLGATTQHTGQRGEYVPVEEVLIELKSWLEGNSLEVKDLQYITFSGAGEPTLNSKIGQLIAEIKKITAVPVAIITNASLLHDPVVRQALAQADLIVPSLDAATAAVFSRIDRPHPGIKVEDIIAGLVHLRREFAGKLWLEVMLVRGVNDDLRHIKKLKAAIEEIKPDKIQLNSPVRTTAEPDIFPIAKAKLAKIKEIFGEKCEVV